MTRLFDRLRARFSSRPGSKAERKQLPAPTNPNEPTAAQEASRPSAPDSDGSSRTQGFHYDPLPQNTLHIRLLSLVSLDGEHPSFVLDAVRLDEAPPYVALSYCWGDPTPRETILVNGVPLKITSNLMQALRSVYRAVARSDAPPLWHENERVLLWADAISINQADIPEKNAQVPMMSEIYKRARGALGYVGSPATGEDPGRAIEAMAELSNTSVGSDPATNQHNPSSGGSAFSDGGASFRRFWSSPWFTRCWVTQEAVLSKLMICLYGNEDRHITVPLDTLGALIHQVQLPGSYRNREALAAARGANTHTAMQAYAWCQMRTTLREHPQGINLVKTLRLTRKAQASDSRDKLFSLLGLIETADRAALSPTVDYSMSNTSDRVFLALAQHCATSAENCMAMLALAGSHTASTSLPTWVPDWTTEPCASLDIRLYRASGTTSFADAQIRLSANGRELTLRALTADKISALGPVVTYPDFTIPEMNVGLEGMLIVVEQAAFLFASQVQERFNRLPGPGTIEDVVMRTVTAGLGLGDRRSLPADRVFYDAFCAHYPRDGSEPPWASRGEQGPDYHPFATLVSHTNAGRRVFTTAAGQIGLAPGDAQAGDWVTWVPGSHLPFILRNVGGNKFKLVGHCYVEGAMDGEIIERFRLLLEEANLPGASVMNMFKEIVLV